MASANKPDPNKQFTPKGAEIPVPKRGEFMDNLSKVAKKGSGLGKRSPKE